MKSKFFVIIFLVFLFISCGRNNLNIFLDNTDDSILTGKYRTEYIIHYNSNYNVTREIYSDKEIYTCSFQGTNFLLEKDNTEEILSTTAPIQIIKSEIVK